MDDILSIRLPTWAQKAEHVVAAGALIYVAKSCYSMGAKKVVGTVMRGAIDFVPGAAAGLDSHLDGEVGQAVVDMLKGSPVAYDICVPEVGVSSDEIFAELDALKKNDVDPSQGLTFAYVYTPFEKSAKQVAEKSGAMFMNLNALNPTAFPSLRKMELEVVSMCRGMTGGVDGVTGSMTSGGTESILMAVKSARNYAKATRGITEPECVLPLSAHPAFAKAGHYLGVKMVWVEVDKATQTPDVSAMKAAISRNTILIVGSAPQYPHGVMDPIVELGQLALAAGCLMHVDSCYGGFVLPWLKAAGYDVPDWDFRVPGVTSISMDVHKYGFCIKGASCIMYRSRDIRIKQYFAYSEWSGGLFVSPSMLGTRAGGPIASAWATMKHFGQDGYVKSTKILMETTAFLRAGVAATPGLSVVGSPVMSAFAIQADSSFDIYAVADVMEEDGGWKLERNKGPPSLHLSVMPPHATTKEKFIADIRAAIKKVKADPGKYSGSGSAAMYGMVASIPDGAVIDQFVEKWMDFVYTTKLPGQ